MGQEMAVDDSNIIGYVDPLVSSPGVKVAVKISCKRNHFTSEVYRLKAGYGHKDAPPVSHEIIDAIGKDKHEGQPQSSRIGSYAEFGAWKGALLNNINSLSIEFWCLATRPADAGHEQYLFSSFDDKKSTGFECFLTTSGNLTLRCGGNSDTQETSLETRLHQDQWYRLTFTVEPQRGRITLLALAEAKDLGNLNREHREEHLLSHPLVIASEKPLIVAADSRGSEVSSTPVQSSTFNGKIDGFLFKTISKGSSETLIDVDFSKGIQTDQIWDTTDTLCGRFINAPSRAMTGHDWDASNGDWRVAKYGYGAVHFHDDDLDDAGWNTSFEIQLPSDLRSGCYGVHVDDGESTDIIPFFVRPDHTSSAAPPVALIIPTFTYTGNSMLSQVVDEESVSWYN